MDDAPEEEPTPAVADEAEPLPAEMSEERQQLQETARQWIEYHEVQDFGMRGGER